MGFRIVLLSVFVLVLQACNKSEEEVADTTPQAQQLSANDLAFLMPLENGRNVPRQVVSVSDPDYGILSQENFREVLLTSRQRGVFVDQEVFDSKNWLLVGFRYSTCMHFSGKVNPCKEQLRFVFQPIERDNVNFKFKDYAMHVVYEFSESTRPQDSPVLASFRALNLLSGGLNEDQPLQSHPVLRNPQFSSTYFDFIKESIISKFVKTSRPKVITFMGLGRNQDGSLNHGIWQFLAGEINSNGLWEIQSLPTGGSEDTQSLFFNGGRLTTNLAQDTSIPFNLFNGNNVNNASIHTSIFNPVATNDHNVDCASCHVTDNQVFRRSAVLQTSENSPFSNNFFDQIDRIGRTSEVLVDNRYRGGKSVQDEIVTRIFGYMNAEPVISQRMINDNAFAVKTANDLAGLPLPDRQCQSEAARRQVSQCLIDGDIRETLFSCMNRFCLGSENSEDEGIQFGN